MNTNIMNNYLVLCQNLSFTKASEQLGMAQSSLSRQILQLENDLGGELFYRTGQKLHLTERGRIYHKSFAKVLNELDGAKRNVLKIHNEAAGEISVAIHPVLAQLATPVIEQMVKESEESVKVKYHFQNSREAIHSVNKMEVDFAIVASVFQHKDIKRVKLWSEFIGLFSLDGRKRGPIYYNENMINQRQLLNKEKEYEAVAVNDYDVIVRTLLAGNGMGFLPSGSWVHHKELQLIKKYPPNFDISLIFRVDQPKLARLQWFRKNLRNQDWLP